MEQTHITGKLCELLGGSAALATTPWMEIEQAELLGANPFGSRPWPQYADLWKALVEEVFPRLRPCQDLVGKMDFYFEHDLVHLRDFVFCTVDVVKYLSEDAPRGLGVSTRGNYEDKGRNYREVSLGPQDFRAFERAGRRFEEQINGLSSPPEYLSDFMKDFFVRLQKLEARVYRSRLNGRYAQRSLFALSAFTGIDAGQIARAVASDLKKMGVPLTQKPENLTRAVRHFKAEVYKSLKLELGAKIPLEEQIYFALSGEFIRAGKAANTFKLTRPRDPFGGEML